MTIIETLKTFRKPLTTKQAADILGLHPQTLYKWSRVPGRVPCFRVGGALRYDPFALAKWVEAGTL